MILRIFRGKLIHYRYIWSRLAKTICSVCLLFLMEKAIGNDNGLGHRFSICIEPPLVFTEIFICKEETDLECVANVEIVLLNNDAFSCHRQNHCYRHRLPSFCLLRHCPLRRCWQRHRGIVPCYQELSSSPVPSPNRSLNTYRNTCDSLSSDPFGTVYHNT